ncbi:uncharacterized protein LOC117320949 [Pecten maximus]|uniref:uncharacterized protein LOC117320949 n=1 Tax=Pecten maximus TaxID=6579 RepID=UPI0014584201|nr:uncharacterized protein LOC117320949 [Pecten maximus]
MKITEVPLGRPGPADIGVDYICLEWESAERDDVTHYEIRMKLASDESWNKTIIPTEDRRPSHRVDDLLQNTGYEFMFRAVYLDGSTSAFSPKSLEIKTKCSEQHNVLQRCLKIHEGPPSVYKLPLLRIHESEDDMTRKLVFGTSTSHREKTILMIGPSESGKTTLIEGLVNHCLGVKWEDDFRFAITDETSTHKGSHTELITYYKVHPIRENGDFILNIIDTPSLKDSSKSTKNNQELLKRLHWFLSTKHLEGINRGIHAVCFVTPANPVQYDGIDNHLRDIFDSIMSICGVNMLENVIPMLTFADGKSPSVLANLSAVGVPTHHHFVFNNSTLFPPYSTDAQLGKTFWQLGSRGNEEFLKYLPNMKPYRIFENTVVQRPVLRKPDERHEIIMHLIGNYTEIDVRLNNLLRLQADRDTVKRCAVDIEKGQTLSCDDTEFVLKGIPLMDGVNICKDCNSICHYPCRIKTSCELYKCFSMKDQTYCTACEGKCHWKRHRLYDHQNSRKIQYDILKAKYELGVEEKIPADYMLLSIKRAFVSSLEEVISLISETAEYSNELQGVQQGEKDFMMHMIDREEQEKEPRSEKRLELLRAIHKKPTTSVADPNTWLHEMGFVDW